MKDKVFIDTNLLIYAIGSDHNKSIRVEQLLREPFFFLISTQVINEFVNTCLRKKLMPLENVKNIVDHYMLFFNLTTIESSTINSAFKFKLKYGFSWYDALIAASAFENNCTILFTEDLQDSMVVEEQLTIQNPFVRA